MRNLSATFLVVLVAACGGGSDNKLPDAAITTQKDAPITTTDGSPTTDDAAAPPACLVATTVTYTPTTNAFVCSEDADPPTQHLYLDDNLNNDAMPDQLEIYLIPGNGAFANTAIAPGTYTITGDDTDYNACGACVTIYGDADPSQMTYTQLFQAVSGTLKLTSVSGTLSGTLTNIVFNSFLIDDNGDQQPDGGNCVTTLASANFSEPITIEPAAFTGKRDANPHHSKQRKHLPANAIRVPVTLQK